MKSFLLVGFGGFLGSYLRYLVTTYLEGSGLGSFPLGTFTVNVVGSFLIGLLAALSFRYDIAPEFQKLLMAGFCGGFTTFSAFSYEGLSLMMESQFLYGFLYTGLSLIVGFLSVWLGLLVVRMV